LQVKGQQDLIDRELEPTLRETQNEEFLKWDKISAKELPTALLSSLEKGEFSDASLDLLERVLQSFLILPDRKSLLFQGSLEQFIVNALRFAVEKNQPRMARLLSVLSFKNYRSSQST
jgi:hypothetical protein